MSDRETKRIRAEVFARAKGCCEACAKWTGEDFRLDHFFGRAKMKQSVENCWALCIGCDTSKTLNEPNAAHWFLRFILHCGRHGYSKMAEIAQAKMDWRQARMGRAT